MKKVLAFAVPLLVCTLFTSACSLFPFGGTAFFVDETRTASAQDIARIRVEDVSCPITIVPGDAVSARLYGECVSVSTPMKLNMTTSGQEVVFSVEYPINGIRRNSCKLMLTLPASFSGELVIGNVSGNIDGNGALSSLSLLRIDTVSGNCGFEQLRAQRAELRSVSGSFVVGFVGSGGVKVNTTSGKTEVRQLSGPADIGSVSGSATLYVAALHGIAFGTTSGNLSVTLAEGADFALDFGSVSGSIRNDFPVLISSQIGKNLVGTVGKGGALIRIRSVSGNAQILRLP